MAKRTKDVTVRFYRAVRGSASGAWPQSGTVEGHIRNKLGLATADPYIEQGDGTYIIENYPNEEAMLHFSISAVRRDNLPLRERGGHTSPLPLPKGDNLAEQAHVIFFPRSAFP